MKNFNIKPLGHLRRFLETQMDGLTGNMAAAGYPFNVSVWGNPEFSSDSWWPWEQTAYWIDGFTRCAVILEDEEAIKKANDIIYSVINNPDDDGYLGPKFLKKNGDSVYRWPHVVFFRACMALYDYNKDEKIPLAISKHYLDCPYDYSYDRDIFNVEIMLWAYGVTSDKNLLELAESSYAAFNAREQKKTITGDSFCDSEFIKKRKIFIHGVSYNEYAKLGALLYKYTGKKSYLKVSEKAMARLERYYKLPGGGISSSEFTLSNRYFDCTETCDISDYTWALENILSVTGKASYADSIERCVFNAGIGAVTEDFRAIQYFSCANQIIINENSNHAITASGNSMMSYSPGHNTQCCPGNVNRFMPNYILNMWDVRKNEIYYKLLGPSVFETEISGKSVKITVNTCYPLSNKFDFDIKTNIPVKINIRVPEFSDGYEGMPEDSIVRNGYLSFTVRNNTSFSAVLKDHIEMHRVYGGVYFTKGALVYSLGMRGNREFYKEETVNGKSFPSYRMSPDKTWNYAVETDKAPVFEEGTAERFDISEDMPHIKISAKKAENWKIHKTVNYKCRNWKYEKIVKKGPFVFTPRIPNMKKAVISDKSEEVTLYPYGASKVRITVLPTVEGQ